MATKKDKKHSDTLSLLKQMTSVKDKQIMITFNTPSNNHGNGRRLKLDKMNLQC